MKHKAITLILLSVMLFPFSAWADLSKTEVSQLYVSIFGRASEGEGNAYWQVQPDMAIAAATMFDTDAAKDYFGANLNTNQAFIEHIYLNTLNKTISDDFDGISYWVNMLDTGTSRGEAVASLVSVINDYAPDGPYYNPDDSATVAAYNQFTNRVEVSDYMADNVWDTPEDWETSTSFSHGLVVSDDPATVFAAKVTVNAFLDEPFFGTCGAYIAPGVWKEFDCYNLATIGKTTNDDPFTPSWRLIGGYWQWGRKGPDPSQWYDTNTEHFAHGPTGLSSNEANDSAVSGWDQTDAPDGAWSDSAKTSNDPCSQGFRVPTKVQWQGVIDNNTSSTVGTWDANFTNYSAARLFGSDLMLPAAGLRALWDGVLEDSRGSLGSYWSSTKDSMGSFWGLSVDSDTANVYLSGSGRGGRSVRCIADDSTSQPSVLATDKTSVSLDSGDNETISISGGTGYYTASSSDTQVAAVTLSGNSAEVTALSAGSAVITVEDTAGETISISVTVTSGSSSSGACGAYVAPGVWKEFDCYNLAAIGKTTNDDPFTPSWRLIGGYWQWGRKGPDSSQWYDTNTANFAHGPTGTGTGEANEGAISSWDDDYAPDGAWSDSYKTANDPCPDGYRVPTKTQWQGVVDNNTNNTQGSVGTWDGNDTNYSAAQFFGNDLMLPSAGYRFPSSGGLYGRSYGGYYWSSSEDSYSSGLAWNQSVGNGGAGSLGSLASRLGGSVRCIAE